MASTPGLVSGPTIHHTLRLRGGWIPEPEDDRSNPIVGAGTRVTVSCSRHAGRDIETLLPSLPPGRRLEDMLSTFTSLPTFQS